MTPRALAVGIGTALGIALPAVLVVQLVDAMGDGDGVPVLAYPAALVVFAGVAAGGWTAARRSASRPVLAGAVVALAAVALLLGLGALRQVVADDDVEWATWPPLAIVATALGAVGGRLGTRPPGRTRP